jgi:hypothetical protein
MPVTAPSFFSACPSTRLVRVTDINGRPGMRSEAGEFVHTFGDLHLYQNHLEQAREQLTRDCRPLPRIKLNPAIKNIHDFKFEDFEARRLQPAPINQSAHRGVTVASASRRRQRIASPLRKGPHLKRLRLRGYRESRLQCHGTEWFFFPYFFTLYFSVSNFEAAAVISVLNRSGKSLHF